MKLKSDEIKRLIRAKYPTQKAFADDLNIDLGVLATMLHRESCGDDAAKSMAKLLKVPLGRIVVKS